MASAARTSYLSIEEYLSTTFRPDVDYVDGRIEERNLGEMDHGTLQGVLFAYFFARRQAWGVWPALDTRFQVKSDSFRVPDLSIVRSEHRSEQIIRTAPLLCVEILSPEDTLRRMLVRIEDYLVMGVPLVWIFDSARRSVTVCGPGGATAEQMNGEITVPGTPIVVNVAEIFSALDEV